ncbi:metallophosphoesterase [Pseudaminobacter sp. 19-2017]|uniref:Metallophosphoesterase n=1 Tax=Pseudaminobacter soli (ex Zhang et al. 2022) TaxID=2831468 RepID=A0A942I2M0_9HYPH|nr:metallophosphoesterase [Pseudaminobacter soli]MBS3648604.1 metallophosphoesterase [Pseudaminobacter soli]
MRKLAGLLGLRRHADRERRARLRLDTAGVAIYAVGDVHGCLDELLSLERAIVADGKDLPARKLIIMLGDYVDRGPASSQVLEHLIAPAPAGFERICLAGNHEVMMLDYIDGRLGLADWMSMGAAATLHSYGIDQERLVQVYRSSRQVDEVIRKAIPAPHVAFLRSMPILVEAPRFIFVHAGVRPELDIAQQTDDDLVLIRSEFYKHSAQLKKYVVHGHTPTAEPKLEDKRVNIDTGAVFGGKLTALRIWQDKGLYLTN